MNSQPSLLCLVQALWPGGVFGRSLTWTGLPGPGCSTELLSASLHGDGDKLLLRFEELGSEMSERISALLPPQGWWHLHRSELAQGRPTVAFDANTWLPLLFACPTLHSGLSFEVCTDSLLDPEKPVPPLLALVSPILHQERVGWIP